MKPSILAFVGSALLLSACDNHRDACTSLCHRMVDPVEDGGCALHAWKTHAQCVQGCIDDLYRRDDAETILACYQGALDGASRATAEDAVDTAIAERLFTGVGTTGGIDREETITDLMARRCDLFAIVRCKTEATRAEWDAPLLSDQ
jgi:hypothetical protein